METFPFSLVFLFVWIPQLLLAPIRAMELGRDLQSIESEDLLKCGA